MLAFLKAYGVTILLAVLIAALLFFAIRYTLRHRHDGCGGCSHCPHAGGCHRQHTDHS